MASRARARDVPVAPSRMAYVLLGHYAPRAAMTFHAYSFAREFCLDTAAYIAAAAIGPKRLVNYVR